MVKKRKGARIGNPIARAAAEAAERKRKAGTQTKAVISRNNELIGNDLLREEDLTDLDESDDLMDAFMVEYPQWSLEVNPEQPWVVTSQIIRAFDSFVMWRNQAAENAEVINLERCFEANKVTDVAPDVREFLIKHGHL